MGKSGLGRATAVLFARKGWQVIATQRKPEQDRALVETPGVTLLALDVTQPEQIRQAAARAVVLGPVDVVFNNAGYGLCGALEGSFATSLARTPAVSTGNERRWGSRRSARPSTRCSSAE